MAQSSSRPSSPSSSQILPWIAFILSIAALYFAKRVLIPVALATLLTFLLTPVTKWLERCRFGRLPAVLTVLLFSLFLIGEVGWVVSNQLLDVINQLPSYQENIRRKLDALHGPQGGILSKTTNTVQELSKGLSTTPSNEPTPLPRESAKRSKASSHATPDLRPGAGPIPVEVIAPPANTLQSLRDLLGPLIGPLGTVLMVIVFALFMLTKREDLRNRLIRLVAKGHLNVMTQAMDDAARRVSRYLLLQFIVNAAFGILMATGLHFIGVPNALLWGALGGCLRFFPYVGPLVAGAFPFVLALAVFSDWTRPMLTIGLFLLIELITANVIEPRLYGAHTGVSSLAILVAAVFWTVLWGPVGLILSTPLTVCLLVVGRYAPQLEFLNILLGDEPVLGPEAQFYQRLLAMDQTEAQAVSEAFLKEKPLVDLYDEVILPALAMAEEDRHQGLLEPTKEAFLIQSIQELIVELANYGPEARREIQNENDSPSESSDRTMESRCRSRVICLPANDQADEITATMLAQLVERAGYPTIALSATDSPLEILEDSHDNRDVVCICSLPPFALLHARTLSKRVHERFPKVRIVVGVWNFSGGGARGQERLGKAFADTVVTTLKQALEELDRVTHSDLCLEQATVRT